MLPSPGRMGVGTSPRVCNRRGHLCSGLLPASFRSPPTAHNLILLINHHRHLAADTSLQCTISAPLSLVSIFSIASQLSHHIICICFSVHFHWRHHLDSVCACSHIGLVCASAAAALAMDDNEKSGITSQKDAKRFTLRHDPSTVTVMDSANIGGGVETGSTGERDMHSDATSEKHATPSADSDVATQQDDSSRSASSPVSSGSGRESALSRPNDDVGDGHSRGGLPGAESTPSSQQQQLESTSGHASDFQSAEGLESDMPDRKGVHHPDSSGDRATDITGIPYIQ